MTSPADPAPRGPARHGTRSGGPDVQGVTTAAPGRSRDRDARMRVYAIQMLVRTLCFVAALFAHGWWQLVLILGAVVLPYIAVVGVNNTGPQAGGEMRVPAAPEPARPALAARPETPAEPVVLVGDVVDDPAPASRRALERGRRA